MIKAFLLVLSLGLLTAVNSLAENCAYDASSIQLLANFIKSDSYLRSPVLESKLKARIRGVTQWLSSNIPELEINLKKVIKDSEGIEILAQSLGGILSMENRTSSLNSKNLILFNQNLIDGVLNRPAFVDPLILHEVLGALGYDDGDYGITSTLFILAKNPKSNQTSNIDASIRETLIEELKSRFSKQTELCKDRIFLAGGSGVGGGGNMWAIYLKIVLLKHFLQCSHLDILQARKLLKLRVMNVEECIKSHPKVTGQCTMLNVDYRTGLVVLSDVLDGPTDEELVSDPLLGVDDLIGRLDLQIFGSNTCPGKEK